jgi:hypothetical protein
LTQVSAELRGAGHGGLLKNPYQCHPEAAPVLREGSALLPTRANSRSFAALRMTPSKKSFSAACQSPRMNSRSFASLKLTGFRGAYARVEKMGTK